MADVKKGSRTLFASLSRRQHGKRATLSAMGAFLLSLERKHSVSCLVGMAAGSLHGVRGAMPLSARNKSVVDLKRHSNPRGYAGLDGILCAAVAPLRVAIINRQRRNRATAVLLTFVMIFQIVAGVFVPNDIFNTQSANAAEWPVGYGYRKQIRIDGDKIQGSLADFPVLISLSDPSLRTTGNGGRVENASGNDIIFTDANNLQLDHEVEKYVAATGELAAWVRVPALAASFDTSIFVYYGKTGVSDPSEDAAGVWNGDFRGVWHMETTGATGAAGDYQDSTSYGSDSIATANYPTSAAGKIDGAQSFNGTDDTIDTGGIETFNLANDFNLCAWARWNATGVDKALLSKSGAFKLDTLDTGQLRFTTLTVMDYQSTFIPTLGTWYQVCVNMTSSNDADFYIDGQLYQSVSGNNPALASVNPVSLGRYNTFFFNGILDEVRISSVARGAEWIATEYQNQSNPTGFYSVGIEEVSAPAALSTFIYRKAVTIDKSKVSGNLKDFPVLVNIPLDASLAEHALSSGNDILFAPANVAWNTGTVNDKLAAEIESFDEATGNLQAWVKVPELSGANDTIIYLYYGCNNGAIASQQNKTAVWDKDFRGVWHMQATGATGAPDDYKDSTAYSNDSIATANYPTAAVGQIDGAQDFDGSTDHINFNKPASLDFTTEDISLEAWFKADTLNSTWRTIFDRGTSGKPGYGLQIDDNNRITASIQASGLDNNQHSSYDVALTPGLMYHAVAVFDRDGVVHLYLNGVEVATDGYAGTNATGSLSSTDNSFYIGSHGSGAWFFDGLIDEVRVSDAVRSADWIATEYANQSNPSEFYSFGIEQVYGAAALSAYGHRKAITIDKDKVSGTLADFPVLVNIPADAELKAQVQDAGKDILFTSDDKDWSDTTNDKLAHEIESYDANTGSLKAWVRIPSLSNAADVTIYVYYGSGESADQENGNDVWDDDTKLVQHMEEDPSGAAPQMIDSTRYGNDGTASGATHLPVSAAGQIAGAVSFDGTDDYVDAGNGSSLNFGTGTYSLSWWAQYPQTQSGTYSGVISKGFTSGATYANTFAITHGGASTNILKYYEIGSATGAFATSVVMEQDIANGWHHFYFARDIANGKLKLYDNGVSVYDAAYSANVNLDNAYNLYLMRMHEGNAFVGGALDEVRVLDVARSAEWIATEYANQSDPSEFYSVGIEQVYGAAALSAYGHRKAITIDKSKVSGSLTDFPVLIDIRNDASLKAQVQDAGKDILFTAGDKNWSDTTNDKLAHEIESYDANTGSLQAWVRLPSLSSGADTTIYMYYGSGESGNQQNKTVVWDNNTKMVQHMNQNPGGAAPQIKDSTQYVNNGTANGNMTVANSVTGQVDGATSFDGIDDYIDVGNNSSLVGPSQTSISFWSKLSSLPSETARVEQIVSTNNWWGPIFSEYTTSDKLLLRVGNASSQIDTISNRTFDKNWHYITFAINNGNNAKIYVDGVLDIQNTLVTAYNFNDVSSWKFGVLDSGSGFPGAMDEVRISNTIRSVSWISTEYNNQSKPTEFASLGIEEVYNAPALSTFSFRKTITIDHTKVSGDLVEFPVLINLPADDLFKVRVQGDGDDILFTGGGVAWNTGTVNDKLAHEIEKYDSVTGSLQAWVKVPNLSSATDTVIYMYYGNTAITTQQNKTVVWDKNTKMVQHMNQNPAGANPAPQMLDSTQYANDGTTSGVMLSEDLVTGRIDGATDFDGVNDYVDCGDKDSSEMAAAVTASAWIKTNSMAQSKTVLARQFGSGYGTYALTPTGTTAFNFVIRVPSGVTTVNKLSPSLNFATLNDNVFHHLVGTYDGSYVRLYLDGVEIGTGTAATGNIVVAAGNLRIGVYQTGFVKYGGIIDEVRVADSARSALWIATEYKNQSNPLKLEGNPDGFLSLGDEQIYRLEVTGTAAQTAGTAQAITVTAKDAAGSTPATFSGDKVVTFSGANTAPDGTAPSCGGVAFGTPMTLTFVSGVATCSLSLYKEEAATIAVTGGTTVGNLGVTVSSAVLNNFLVAVPDGPVDAGTAFAATVTARDAYENILTDFNSSVTLSAEEGEVSRTITPSSISDFTDGAWSGNLTISGIVEQPSIAVTATRNSSVGSDSISILGIPQAPGSVSASRVSDTEFTVAWADTSTVETGFKIERKTDGGGYTELGTALDGSTSFADDTTLSDHNYQYRVRAYNELGNGAYDEDATIHYTTPDTPSGVMGDYVSDASFSVSYEDNAAVTDTHRIGRCSGADCDIPSYASVGTFPSSPQIDSAGIAAYARYRWQVRAETPDSVYSDYAVSNFEYTTPAAPAMGTIAVVSGTELTVAWTDSSSYEDGFRLEVSVDGGAYAEVTPGTNTVGANIATYSFTSDSDHSYKFRVRAHIGATSNNSALFSAYSESSTVYTSSAAPTIATPVVVSSTAIAWNWSDNSAFEENFHLHFTTGGGGDVNDIAADTESHQTDGLTPNTLYAAHVHAWRAGAGESDASADAAAVYTFAEAPSMPVLTADSQTQITAAWSASANPVDTRYYIENINTGDNSGWTTGTSWVSDELLCSTEYAFRVKARNGSDIDTAYSASVSLATQPCASGGSLPGAGNPPRFPEKTADNPTGQFKVLINDGAEHAGSPSVKLALFAGADTTRMAVSNTPDFNQASLAPYRTEVLWDITKDSGKNTDGAYVVYAKFYTKRGTASGVVSDSIVLDTTAPTLELNALRDRYATTDSIAVTGATEAGARVIYNLDSVLTGVITAGADGKLILDLGKLAAGTHSLQIIAQDALGNASLTAQYFLYVQTPAMPSAPTIPAVPGPSAPHASELAPEANPAAETAVNSDASPDSADAPTVDVVAEVPRSLSGQWNLLSLKSFPQDITTQDVEMIVEKFPEFKTTFQKLGLIDLDDAARLQGVSFNIPSLSEVMGLGSTGLDALNLPDISVPLAEISAAFKQEIPSGVIFVKTKNENLDVSSILAFDNGTADQRINLLSGRSFQLILKPDQEVDSIKGYLTYKKDQLSQADDGGMVRKLACALGLGAAALAQNEVEEKLVLSEFEYRDDDGDGIWTADITTPQVAGSYEVITVLDYKDVRIGSKTLRLITVVDPEGYVFESIKGQELHIKNATVSLYRLDVFSGEYKLWDADAYQQSNPQVTDERGTYSFLVPAGTYLLEAHAQGYGAYGGEPFEVTIGSGIHTNLELMPAYDWQDRLTWERLLLVVFGIALFYNYYGDRKKKKRTDNQ